MSFTQICSYYSIDTLYAEKASELPVNNLLQLYMLSVSFDQKDLCRDIGPILLKLVQSDVELGLIKVLEHIRLFELQNTQDEKMQCLRDISDTIAHLEVCCAITGYSLHCYRGFIILIPINIL